MPSAATDPFAYLYAHTPLSDFLAYMARETVDGPELDRDRLTDEWRAANARFQELQHTEAGWADGPVVGSIPKSLEPLVRQVAADPIFLRSFSSVPGQIGMVELDRLAVSQKTINLSHVARLKEQTGPSPDVDAVFRACLPFDHPTPPALVSRVAKHTFEIVSESNDLRFLESLALSSEQLTGYQATGPVVAVVGAVVGFGSNFLNVLACEGRLVLNNGFHRAYALRALGVTHVPCVVQRLASREDLQHVGRAAVRRDPDLYFGLARPPVLKDFFDPTLSREVLCPRKVRHVRVTLTVEEFDGPCLSGSPSPLRGGG
jgi:hypothetical protein